MSHTNNNIALPLSTRYVDETPQEEDKAKLHIYKHCWWHFKLNFIRQKKQFLKKIKHSSNGFDSSFITGNNLSHKPKRSWQNLMLCPKLISYFISKRNIKEHFLKLFTQVSWQKTTSISRPGSSWKTWYWYCLSNFLQTTGFQSQVIKKSISWSFLLKFLERKQSDLKVLVKVQRWHTWCCLRNIFYCFPN